LSGLGIDAAERSNATATVGHDGGIHQNEAPMVGYRIASCSEDCHQVCESVHTLPTLLPMAYPT